MTLIIATESRTSINNHTTSPPHRRSQLTSENVQLKSMIAKIKFKLKFSVLLLFSTFLALIQTYQSDRINARDQDTIRILYD